MNARKLIAATILLVTASILIAQELPKLDSEIPSPKSSAPAFVVMCDSDPARMIVLDSTGKWLADIKSATITIKFGSPAQLRCEVWSGPIRPSKPQILTWDLSQVQSVTAADFQTMVDNLQTDPNYVKNSRATPPAPVGKKGN